MSGMSVTNRGLHQNKTRDDNFSPPEQPNLNGSSSILHIMKKKKKTLQSDQANKPCGL
jgi:hypothetical protein